MENYRPMDISEILRTPNLAGQKVEVDGTPKDIHMTSQTSERIEYTGRLHQGIIFPSERHLPFKGCVDKKKPNADSDLKHLKISEEHGIWVKMEGELEIMGCLDDEFTLTLVRGEDGSYEYNPRAVIGPDTKTYRLKLDFVFIPGLDF